MPAPLPRPARAGPAGGGTPSLAARRHDLECELEPGVAGEHPQSVEKGRLNDDLGVLAANATFVGERDVLTRQLFLRKNGVPRDPRDIRAVTESRWHLQSWQKQWSRARSGPGRAGSATTP